MHSTFTWFCNFRNGKSYKIRAPTVRKICPGFQLNQHIFFLALIARIGKFRCSENFQSETLRLREGFSRSPQDLYDIIIWIFVKRLFYEIYTEKEYLNAILIEFEALTSWFTRFRSPFQIKTVESESYSVHFRKIIFPFFPNFMKITGHL